MKFVAMSGNQLRVTLSLYTLYIAMSPEPAHCTMWPLWRQVAWTWALGSATGRINMKSLGLFLFRLNASWQGLAGGLLLWLMGIPEASDFMSIPWNKNSVPGVNENFLTQITQTSTGAQGVQLDFWTELLVEKIPDVIWTRSDHDEVFTDHSDLIRMTRLASLWTRNKSWTAQLPLILWTSHFISLTGMTLKQFIHHTNFKSSLILSYLSSIYLLKCKLMFGLVWFFLFCTNDGAFAYMYVNKKRLYEQTFIAKVTSHFRFIF